MAARIDLMLIDGDLPITASVMPVHYSDEQHIVDRFSAAAGWWKQYPNAGINIRSYLKSTGVQLLFLKNNATQQLKADGYNASNMSFTNDATGKLIIRPNATRV